VVLQLWRWYCHGTAVVLPWYCRGTAVVLPWYQCGVDLLLLCGLSTGQ
jgi:hypothetical protein